MHNFDAIVAQEIEQRKWGGTYFLTASQQFLL
jgi:hypothetical protein